MTNPLRSCRLCPRDCGTDRTVSKPRGFCRCGEQPYIVNSYLHHWEEPCISGTDGIRGSGAVFFSSCQLRCVYCQNNDFSRKETGTAFTPQMLSELFLRLQDEGAYNINLVTPTPHIYSIISAVELCKGHLNIPLVYNTSGYEKPETITLLNDYISVYLTDMKYFSAELAGKLSSAPDYYEFASTSLAKMLIKNIIFNKYGDQTILENGVLVRHLVLPGHYHDSLDIIDRVADIFDSFSVNGEPPALFSLMSQYTPNSDSSLPAGMNRKILTLEYQTAKKRCISRGMSGYFQDISSAKNGYVPEINKTTIN
ncbi:MAG: radical SAM protein [Oscillospiraceae bacterium]|nr:radical SAM protein [Oscillospiraceae bacterium]